MNLGPIHPIIVHFAIAFVVAGVVLRLISLLKRPAFAGPAATTLILAGAVCVLLAVKSGNDAHGPVERVPGSAEAVHEHEEAAEVTRNFIVVLALVEIVGLFLRNSRFERHAPIASSVIGIGTLVFLLITANRGGDLVYSRAGGVGIRTGKPEDVGNLLLAGLYHQVQLDRTAGRRSDAAVLADTALHRFPQSIPVRLFQAESLLLDRQDPAAALAALGTIEVPKADQRSKVRYGFLKADAFLAAGRHADAKATLQTLATEFPDDSRVKERLSGL